MLFINKQQAGKLPKAPESFSKQGRRGEIKKSRSFLGCATNCLPRYFKNRRWYQSLLLVNLLTPFFSLTAIAQPQLEELTCSLTSQTIINQSHPHFITESDFDSYTPNLPNLWWAKEQFDPFNGKLIQGWMINTEEKTVDLLINRQLWTILDYIKRYRLVNQMGTVAREYQYNLRVFNRPNQCVAFYECDFSTTPYSCRVDFNSTEANSLELNN